MKIAFFIFITICVIVPNATAGNVSYTYDNVGRLTKADYGGGNTSTYTYDKAGNLLERNVTGQPVNVDPVPDIKVNGSDSQITIGTNDTLSISVGVDAGSSLGVESDWWLVVNTPTGEWEYYDLTQGAYTPGLLVTYQGALFDLGSYEIFNTSGLDAGTYTFYFGVDMVMNGSLDMGSIYYDSVVVNITLF